MSRAEDYGCDGAALLLDRDTLAANLELILSGGPQAPDILARLFDEFREAIEGGLPGINQARNTLSVAIELACLHSEEHAAALELYRLSLEGKLKPAGEPATLISGAINRSTAPKRAARRGSVP